MLHSWPESPLLIDVLCLLYKSIESLVIMHAETSTFLHSVATILSVDACMCDKKDCAKC